MFGYDNDRFPPGKTWQQQMLKASGYAAQAQEHPLYRLASRGKQMNEYGLALLDFLGKPQLVGMDISRWTGGIGQTIRIQVRDNIRVLHVRVMIRRHKTSDKVLESGHACPSKLSPWVWNYITRTQIEQSSGFCIDVLTTDLPGNVGVDTMEFTSE
jgi:hypothetical protein